LQPFETPRNHQRKAWRFQGKAWRFQGKILRFQENPWQKKEKVWRRSGSPETPTARASPHERWVTPSGQRPRLNPRSPAPGAFLLGVRQFPRMRGGPSDLKPKLTPRDSRRRPAASRR
jgi:hypothetical protein